MDLDSNECARCGGSLEGFPDMAVHAKPIRLADGASRFVPVHAEELECWKVLREDSIKAIAELSIDVGILMRATGTPRRDVREAGTSREAK